ncbi:MAG: EamA family transporter [Actinobacteria bacterium]|nr:EamA family transporter [Actinomycetota bacterium]MBO0785943.1 EamA family transporter [Actinomycetota bacterium]MBO0817115.1 EamA family transporter [Actinomycetota bacterium]
MSPVALALVLTAAFTHATWNLLSKQAADSAGAAYVWLISLTGTVLYAPAVAVAVFLARPHIGPVQLLFLAGTAVLHTVYFLLLQAGYQRADLSVLYPLARGTGPLLASLTAIAAEGVRPSGLGLAGIGLIASGLLSLSVHRGMLRTRNGRLGIGLGLATGVLIAAYTLWDAHSVQALGVPPLLQEWASGVGGVVLLGPLAWARRPGVASAWLLHRRQVVGAGVLSPLSYILVLVALTTTSVTAVAPVREVSVIVGVLFGGKLLAEGDLARRLAGAVLVAAGIVAIALG